MFSATNLVISGTVGTLGGIAAGLFLNSEGIGKNNSLCMRITKIALGAIFGALLFGTATFGLCVIASTKGVVFAVAVLIIAIAKVVLSQ